MKAWEQGWKEKAIGKVNRQKLNPLGSSIAVGHPFAATGGRIVTTLAYEMQRRDAKYGLELPAESNLCPIHPFYLAKNFRGYF